MRMALSLGSLSLLLLAACSAAPDDTASSTEALTELTASSCKTPTVHTTAKEDADGNEIAGSAHTTISGCIVGAKNETGEDVLARLVTLMADTSKLSAVKNDQGANVFSRFSPGAHSGSLTASGGLLQDIDVTLAMTGSPKTTLHAVQKRPAGAPYTITLTNRTPVVASVFFFSVTAVNTGDLSLSIKVTPQANGITVTGTSDIVLQEEQDQAANASAVVTDVFDWLKSNLEP